MLAVSSNSLNETVDNLLSALDGLSVYDAEYATAEAMRKIKNTSKFATKDVRSEPNCAVSQGSR